MSCRLRRRRWCAAIKSVSSSRPIASDGDAQLPQHTTPTGRTNHVARRSRSAARSVGESRRTPPAYRAVPDGVAIAGESSTIIKRLRPSNDNNCCTGTHRDDRTRYSPKTDRGAPLTATHPISIHRSRITHALRLNSPADKPSAATSVTAAPSDPANAISNPFAHHSRAALRLTSPAGQRSIAAA